MEYHEIHFPAPPLCPARIPANASEKANYAVSVRELKQAVMPEISSPYADEVNGERWLSFINPNAITR